MLNKSTTLRVSGLVTHTLRSLYHNTTHSINGESNISIDYVSASYTCAEVHTVTMSGLEEDTDIKHWQK